MGRHMNVILKTLSWREIDSSHRLMMLIVAALGLFNFFFGEIVPVNGGLGWDGVNYAKMTHSIGSMISDGQLSNYYAQRILPSVIVRGLLLVTGASFSTINIIRGFELYNLVLLVATCWLWKRLAHNYSISLAGRWLGFSGLFLSYMGSKQVFFYPVLTDVTAFFVGMLLLIFYVEKRPLALLATAIVGALAWQVVGISGALLLFFMRYDLPSEVLTPAPDQLLLDTDKFARKIMSWWTILLLVSIACVAVLAGVNDYINNSRLLPVWHSQRLIRRLIEFLVSLEQFFTGLPSLVAVVIALVMLVGSGLFFRVLCAESWKKRLPLVVFAVAALLIPRAIVWAISNPSVKNVSGMKLVLSIALLPPREKILLPIVTHIVYWGPLVMLLVIKWKEFCIEARKLGPGYMAIVALSLPLGLCTEPRFITCAWPFFVLGIVLVMEHASMSRSSKYVYSVFTIFYSQFWLPINSAPWTPDHYGGYNSLYFMHHGMFMVMDVMPYIIYVICISATFLWLADSLRTAKPALGDSVGVLPKA